MTNSIIFFIIAFLCVVMLILVFAGSHKFRVEQRQIDDKKGDDQTSSSPLIQYSARHIRNIRIGSLLLFLYYTFEIFIPNYYTWIAEIPPIETLHITNGEFTYQDYGRRGNRLTGIKTASGTILFTCSTGKFGEYPDCLFPTSEYERYSRQPATVWWYEQPVQLFQTQNRVVMLKIAGKEEISYAKTLALTQKSSRNAPWLIFMMLFIFILIVVGFERLIRRNKNG